MSTIDRLKQLRAQDRVNGIDFVHVQDDQVTLDVYFLRKPTTGSAPLIYAGILTTDLKPDQIRIYSPTGGAADVSVETVGAAEIDARYVLRLTVAHPGDFTLYRLRIDDPRIDPYFADVVPQGPKAVRGHNDIWFSFKAECESGLDCAPTPLECPPQDVVDFPVEYRARDFWSFRRALLDFAAQRYPDWQDRLEADAGLMLVEAMSALADEMAYYQDRVAREGYLETATQRRSLRQHARLVDYVIHDGRGATTWLELTVKDGQSGAIPTGADVWAIADDGSQIRYEVGRGLNDPRSDYDVDAARNALLPHIWDENDACLPVGATHLFVKGHHAAHLPLDETLPGRQPGRWVLLRTDPTDPALPARRWPVRLIGVSKDDEETDPLIDDPETGHAITRLVWEPEQSLPFPLDLTTLTVRGNLVPATAGVTQQADFIIGPTDDPTARPEAVERKGPGDAVTYLFSLPETDEDALVWLGAETRGAEPEVLLTELRENGSGLVEGSPWTWRRALIGTDASQPDDAHFTLDDGTWERVVGYRRIGTEIVHRDYASGEGMTVRFGDGEFGRIPAEGTVFRATYRLGNGRRGNVPADTLTHFDAGALPFVDTVTNPLPATDGEDAETPEEIRKLAPEAFSALTYRAVRPEDYAEAAERLPWVQRAGATTRWTGSWLTVFATPDPQGAVTLTSDQRSALSDQLDRFRQAGREAHAGTPRYVTLDLRITVCVEPHAYRGETKAAVLEKLFGKGGVRSKPGFFSPDNFTFGTPLDRAALEAAIQAAPGVRAVGEISFRRRGWFDWRTFSELLHIVAMDQVIRVANDPLHPEHGTLKLSMEGGA